jgi:hypothetical protein
VLNEPVPKLPDSVVVETPVTKEESVLYAKPLTVGLLPPVDDISPLSVAAVAVTPLAVLVVTVGSEVVVKFRLLLQPVPVKFVAYART